jgi:outer membrane murein-binding lipoprotein Lpp
VKTRIVPVLAVSLALAGCAKKSYVQREVGEVNKKVDAVSAEVEKTQQRVQQNEVQIAAVDKQAQSGITEAKGSASCKGRGVCPSCNGRHMAQTAAHLADHVIPPVPVRQWVISVPKRLRCFLANRPEAIAALTKIFLAEIEHWVGPGRSRKSTWPGANGVVDLLPFEFLDRLADLVPPPRKHRHRLPP